MACCHHEPGSGNSDNSEKSFGVRGVGTGSALSTELVSHLPFSVSAVTLGLILAGIICFLGPQKGGRTGSQAGSEPVTLHSHAGPAGTESDTLAEKSHEHSDGSEAGHEHEQASLFGLFHLFHPAHMLFSAAATTAMFRRYDRALIKALFVGIFGAVVICGISDIVLPHVALLTMGYRLHAHICIIEHPMLVLPMAAMGVLLGMFASEGVASSTYFSHSLHVFTSTMASIFYMVAAIGQTAWFDQIGVVFLCVVLAVMVPCCLSDIVFPLLMTKKAQQRFLVEDHGHNH